MPRRCKRGLDQQEVAAGVLLLAEEGVDHRAGGIGHRDQQRERRHPVPQPRVMTTEHLDQHSACPSAAFAGGVPGALAGACAADCSARVDQDALQCGPVVVDALALTQQLAEM